ncbi:MAG: hypothetical protein IVW55_17255 [Chloroflexi bacterium]|nr:hypothetical protein [Chloroflexota bacterium]
MTVDPDESTGTVAEANPGAGASEGTGAVAGPGAAAPMEATAFNLLDAMRQPGCPICKLVSKMVFSYLDGISYESVNDPGVREELQRSLGYCAMHGQQWLGMRDALGTAIIYKAVLERVLRTLQARVAPMSEADRGWPVLGATGESSLIDRLQSFLGSAGGEHSGTEPGSTLARELEAEAPCPACDYTVKLEESMADAFAKGLAHPPFMDAYRHHDMGLCLPHFRQVLRLVSAPDLLHAAVQVQEACLMRTCTELAEVIRKHDYRYTGEPRSEEFRAPARSVEQAWGTLPTHLNLPSDARHARSL